MWVMGAHLPSFTEMERVAELDLEICDIAAEHGLA